jgi:hypothetical protein
MPLLSHCSRRRASSSSIPALAMPQKSKPSSVANDFTKRVWCSIGCKWKYLLQIYPSFCKALPKKVGCSFFLFIFDFMMALLLKWLLLLHPFYVSTTEINHNTKSGELEISVRLFTADLEETLRKNYKAKVDLLSSAAAQKSADDALVSRYITGRLQLLVDGKPCTLKFVGREVSEENTWGYFEVENVKAVKKLHISNKLLYDWQPQQSNMHVVKCNGGEKTYKLDNPASEVDFNW